MLENVLAIGVTDHGTIIEEVEIFCCMTGFKRHLLVEYAVEGLLSSVEMFG